MPLSLRGQEDDRASTNRPPRRPSSSNGEWTRKYDADKRRGHLEDALEEDDHALRRLSPRPPAQLCSKDREGYGKPSLMSVHHACPRFDEEVPYTWRHCLRRGPESEALDWFHQFQWESRTGKPISPRNRKRVEQVEAVLPELQFLIEYTAHRDARRPASWTRWPPEMPNTFRPCPPTVRCCSLPAPESARPRGIS